MSVEQTLLRSLVFTKFAVVHFCSGRWDLKLGFSVVVLQSVGEQRRLLMELFSTHLTFKWSFAAQSMDLHVVMETYFFVSSEITVSALIFLSGYHVLVLILSVALEETTRFELLAT